MGEKIKGKPVAEALTVEVKKEIEKLKKENLVPKLKFVRVGAKKDDLAYERAAIKRMTSCGINHEVLELPLDVSKDDLITSLRTVNDDNTVHGILLFRPLPKHINENDIKFAISPEKDVDCFNPINVAKMLEGDNTGFLPCTPLAAMELLKYYNMELKGKNAVVVGRSMVIGKPMSLMLLKEDATVTICHSKTVNLAEITSKADILVAAVGKANMITENHIKKGAVIIDVGINVEDDGNIVGDVNTESCLDKAGFITPVPSGVGSVTTSVLAKNVVKACKALTMDKEID